MLMLLGVGCVIHAGGCNTAFAAVQGSGTAKSETRDVAQFRRVVFNGSAKVNITIGQPQQLTISGDDNILPLIDTAVTGDELTIGSHGSYSPKTPLRIDITVPSLGAFALNGSGDVHITGLNEKDLKVVIRGSGDLKADGSVETIDASIKGSGNLDLVNVATKNATISIAGSGDATVNATEALDASIAGSGDIKYKGNPPKVNRSVAGSGKVRPIG
jgi:hypothetical protein